MSSHSIAAKANKAVKYLDIIIGICFISLLFFLFFFSFFRSPDSSYMLVFEARIEADFKVMQDAIMLFERDTGRCPNSWNELIIQQKEIQGWDGPYLNRQPLDPWTRTYILSVTKPIEIKTFGADGKLGGEDENRDYSSLEFQKSRD